MDQLMERVLNSNDGEGSCEECGRSAARVEQEQNDPGLLPYRSCKLCQLPFYFKPDAQYVGTTLDEGEVVLHVDCCMRDWGAALERVRLFPMEAAPVKLNLRIPSALHWACYKRAPRTLIQAMVEAHPEALSHASEYFDGAPPLHLVFSMPDRPEESFDLIKTLVDANIESVNAKNHMDCDAFDYAFQNCYNEVESSLNKNLEQDPDPFRYAEGLENGVCESFEWKWKIVCLLVRASHYKNTDINSGPILHALAAKHECAADFLRFGIKLHPQQLVQPDQDGNTPLHIATKMLKPQRDEDSYVEWEDVYGCATVKWYREHATNARYAAEQVKLLIEAAPEASKARNHEGKLPIHIAILSKKNWDEIIKHLVHAHPRSLESRDPESGLYPFMLAATLCQADKDFCQSSSDDSSNDCSSCDSCWEMGNPASVAAQTLNVSYMLLLACPELHKFGNWMKKTSSTSPRRGSH